MTENIENSTEEKPIEKIVVNNQSKSTSVTPVTRRIIIASLTLITLISILSEIYLVFSGIATSEALLSIASVSTGALAGALLPGE